MTSTERSEIPAVGLLQQMDRRLELIETDARRFHQELSTRIEQLDQKIDRQGESLSSRIDRQGEILSQRIDRQGEILSQRIDQFQRESNRRFYWLVGILLTGGTAVLGLLARLSIIQ